MIQNFNGGGLLNNYSTEEQVIGTWIDGKPIYRKFIQIDLSSSHSSSFITPHNINDIDIIVNYYGNILNSSSQNYINCNVYNGSSYRMLTFVNKTNITNINVGYLGTLDLFIEYTKTTD